MKIQNTKAITAMRHTLSLGETMALFTATKKTSLGQASLFKRDFGGAESNFAIALARLGFKASWYSRLGADPLGQSIHAAIAAEHVDVSHAALVPGARTGIYFKTLTQTGVEVHYDRHHSAFSQLRAADLAANFIRNHNVLHLTGITACLTENCFQAAEAAIAYFKAKPPHNAVIKPLVCFDLNIRAKLWQGKVTQKRLCALVKKSDLIMGSIDECAQLAGQNFTNAAAAAAWLSQTLGAAEVVIKLGSKGAHYFSQTTAHYLPAFTVPVIVDPVGAGDAFAAGFIAASLTGLPIAKRLLYGNALGALVMSAHGDSTALPTQQQLKTFLEHHHPQLQPTATTAAEPLIKR